MNSLESFLEAQGLDESSAMNKLQDAGVISDNAITAQDVANGDCLRAVKWLLNHL